ncbi:sensor histidine kinase [Streptomyces sp. NPDC004629]|uniref:sensor histidine kinase n=1 Tax=Streptomyces sp. NPDC004629 TaxID=3364705 RepID=UPI0036D183EC
MTKSGRALGRWRSLGIWAAVFCLGLPALPGPPIALLLAFSAFVALSVPLLRWPWGRITENTAAYTALAVSLLTDVAYVGKPGLVLLWMPFEFVGLLVLTGRLIRRARPRRLIPVALVAVLTTTALPLRFTLRTPESGTSGVVIMVFITLMPVACAAGIGGYLRATDHRRQRAVLQARREQRLHMARVLHDFVAHEVTGMVLEVQAAQASAYDPEQHQALLSRVEQAGLRALDSMDRTLQTLREAEDEHHGTPGQEPAQPSTRVYGLADLPDLVRRFAESSSITTELDLAEELVGMLPREVEETAYSLVLESLTNVRRHAASARLVRVAVEQAGDAVLRVSVTNDGGSGKSLHPHREGGGTGLVGMDERFKILGGTVTAGPSADGWQVTGTLPLPSPAAGNAAAR